MRHMRHISPSFKSWHVNLKSALAIKLKSCPSSCSRNLVSQSLLTASDLDLSGSLDITAAGDLNSLGPKLQACRLSPEALGEGGEGIAEREAATVQKERKFSSRRGQQTRRIGSGVLHDPSAV